jgi:predicted ribosome quality control (RQC) complex YloA/Tae2 family protein
VYGVNLDVKNYYYIHLVLVHVERFNYNVLELTTMHKTTTGNKIKALRSTAREKARDARIAERAANVLPNARETAQELQEEADKLMVEAEALERAARLEDLNVWIMEKAKTTKKGDRTYRYWMANWREGGSLFQRGVVRNVHLGSCDKMDEETALLKARTMKAKALGIDL